MFNNFNLSDEEVIDIIERYNPLIINYSMINGKCGEDLCQEIKLTIFSELTKNRKKF